MSFEELLRENLWRNFPWLVRTFATGENLNQILVHFVGFLRQFWLKFLVWNNFCIYLGTRRQCSNIFFQILIWHKFFTFSPKFWLLFFPCELSNFYYVVWPASDHASKSAVILFWNIITFVHILYKQKFYSFRVCHIKNTLFALQTSFQSQEEIFRVFIAKFYGVCDWLEIFAIYSFWNAKKLMKMNAEPLWTITRSWGQFFSFCVKMLGFFSYRRHEWKVFSSSV